MFVELTEKAWNRFKPYLDNNGYVYEASEATLPKDSVRHFRIDITEEKNMDKILKLAREVDAAYGLIPDTVSGADKDKGIERD